MSLKKCLRAVRNILARIASIASRATTTDAGCVWAPKTINARKTVKNKTVVCFFSNPADLKNQNLI